jgi:hypothetical protein
MTADQPDASARPVDEHDRRLGRRGRGSATGEDGGAEHEHGGREDRERRASAAGGG